MANKITITDIANLAGVTKATVSYYLNGKTSKMSEKTAQKIKNAIEKTGYTPSIAARSLNSKGSHLFGVIIGNITNSFANQTVKGIEDYARQNDYLSIVASSEFNPEHEKKYINSMLAMGVDGFLVQPTKLFRETVNLNNLNKPIVYFDSAGNDENTMYVKTDNYDITYSTINRLIDKGYEYFCLVSNNPYALQTREERNNACIDALNERNIPYKSIIINSDKDEDYFKSKLYPILNSRKNVCIFAFNNSLLQMAFIALEPYKDRIPEIGLIGFDHAEWCRHTNPSITLIDQPAYNEGNEACKILINQIEKRGEKTERLILKSTLVERETTDLKK